MKLLNSGLFGLIISLYTVGAISAQGLVFNDEVYQKSPHKSFQGSGVKGEMEAMTNQLKVDLKPWCPRVASQGEIGSCVGWATGYAALSIAHAIEKGWKDETNLITDHAFSALFLYNQIKIGDCSFGAELDKAFSFLQEKGNLFYRDFRVSLNDCDTMPNRVLIQKARVNRIKDYVALFEPDANETDKIRRIKLSLVNQKPVVIGIVLRQNFLHLKAYDQYWYPQVGNTTLYGGHAMVVVGFDETRGAFEVMNSWGDGWGNRGYMWIKYSDFAEHCKYAYEFYLDSHTEDFLMLEGVLSVLKPSIKSSLTNNVLFEELPFKYDKGMYRFENAQTTWPFEFQLLLKRIKKETYLYVISFDEKLNASVQWPRNEIFNSSYRDVYHSSMMFSDFPQINIPEKYSVYKINYPTREYLCLLNSPYPIKRLNEKIIELSKVEGDLLSKIQQVFGDASDVHTDQIFEKDNISFIAQVAPRQILPIVLEFDLE